MYSVHYAVYIYGILASFHFIFFISFLKSFYTRCLEGFNGWSISCDSLYQVPPDFLLKEIIRYDYKRFLGVALVSSVRA